MRILLVEDQEKLNQSLKFQLQKEGFLVDSCMDGDDACYYIEQQIYDLILLDRMLPGMDGLTILKEMRKRNDTTPVLLLTALGTLQDKVEGLNLGADDYLVKPFAFEELLARIRCIARRPKKLEHEFVLAFCDITLHTQSYVLASPSGSCILSQKEAALLEVFLRNPNQTLSRSLLLNKVWGPESDVEDGNLDNYIYFLRRRLKAVSDMVILKTVRGTGYHMEENRGK